MDAYDIKEISSQGSIDGHIYFHAKPMMIYYFLDPLCTDSWITEAYLKKMTVEYGTYFNIRPVIRHHLHTDSPLVKDTSTNLKLSMPDRYYLSVSMKAASFQGNRAGRNFLRHIQQLMMLHQDYLHTTSEKVMYTLVEQAAKKVNLDLKEFYDDLFSETVKKSYQSDIQLKHEMDVTEYPTLVFSSEYIDDYSIKISGVQNYATYKYILKDMLRFELPAHKKPNLRKAFTYFKSLQTEDIAFMYDYTFKEAEKQLKQLQLLQIVKKVEVNGFHLWEYCG